MIACDECMEILHIEDYYESEAILQRGEPDKCSFCELNKSRYYEVEKEHLQNLMKKYKKLLGQLDLDKLLDE